MISRDSSDLRVTKDSNEKEGKREEGEEVEEGKEEGEGQPLKSVFAEARLELCRHFPFSVKMERPQMFLVQKKNSWVHSFFSPEKVKM